MGAEFRVLFTGYVGDRVGSTVSFVRDGDVRVIIDPGMVPHQAAILGPLEALVGSPDEITFMTSGRSTRAMSGRRVRRKASPSARRSI